MKKFRKAIGTVCLTGALIAGSVTTSFAVTPHYTSWVPKIPTITSEDLPDSVKDEISQIVSGWQNGQTGTTTKLGKTSVTEATYHHYRAIWDRARLQVRWNAVDGAKSYEVKVTKTDGSSKVYTTSSTSLIVYEDSDSFMTDCVRSGKVTVRAVGSNGTYGAWSAAKTISCNSLHY